MAVSDFLYFQWPVLEGRYKLFKNIKELNTFIVYYIIAYYRLTNIVSNSFFISECMKACKINITITEIINLGKHF